MLAPFAATIVLAACQSNETASEQSAPTAVEPAESAVLRDLVRFGNRVRELGPMQLAEQYGRLAFGEGRDSDEAAIRLSLLLSAPNSPIHDVDRATRTLRAVLDGESRPDTEQEDFALLVHHLLSERVYAASEDEMLAARLSEARNRNEQLSEELDTVRAQLDAERSRRETLEQQLDALKRLEEQLSLDVFERP